MERSVLATALSHTGPHSGGRVISLHSLSDTEKQSVRVSAVFVRLEFVVGMDIEDRSSLSYRLDNGSPGQITSRKNRESIRWKIHERNLDRRQKKRRRAKQSSDAFRA